MSLEKLLDISSNRELKQGMSEERLRAQIGPLRKLIAFYREYPDYFIDYLVWGTHKPTQEMRDRHPSNFHFFFYQRIFLRIVMRHRYVYATFPRAYSKSFLSVMALMIRCILYPNVELFVTTGGKEQAASITLAKVEEICTLIPALNNEINWARGVSKHSKDDVNYVFKNGSKLNVLAARQSSRGQRRTGRQKFFPSLRTRKNKIYFTFLIYNKKNNKIQGEKSMIGFIYHIKNKMNGKEYIGQTIDIDWRLYKHLNALRKNKHHSTKLQRAFNKYGEDNFEISYRQEIFENYQDLLIAEQQEIAKYDSYNNGYNETLGGEGHSIIFDFDTMVLLYQIGKRYDGIKHKLAEYYHCDRTSITSVFNKKYLELMTYDEEKLNELIEELGLESKNLKENYINNYDRKLTTDQVLKILSIIEIKRYSQSACAKVFHVNADIISGIIRGKTYKEDYNIFLKLSLEEKQKLADELCNTTDIIRLHYEGQRGPVKNPLTQEQVNYILDNIDKKTQTQIGKDLGISADRVRSVKNRVSYLDMIWVYEKEHSSN